ncbi:MAG: FUSC family protein [Actinomycetota bacterium]|nr:FUSC family protein [Actinomycetota bacterium]
MALTASVVLRRDFSVTFSRGLARMAGACNGVVLAGLLVVALHANAAAEIIVIGLLAVAVGASFGASYALFTGFLTGLVVLLVGVVAPGTFATAVDRLEGTLVGGALALAVYGLWPTWSEQQAPKAFASLVARQRDYLGAVLAVASGTRPLDRREMRGLARDARRAKAAADEAIVRSADEPEGRRFSLTKGRGILAALSRISLAAHALRSDVEDGRLGEPVPAWTPWPMMSPTPWPGWAISSSTRRRRRRSGCDRRCVIATMSWQKRWRA